MRLVDDYGIVAVLLALQFTERITEFLHGADDYASTLIDRLGKSLAAPAYILHYTCLRCECVDVIRHVGIEHDAVGDHDD